MLEQFAHVFRPASRWVICALIGYLIIRPVGSMVVLVPVLALLGVLSVVTLAMNRRVAWRPAAVVGAVVLIGVYGALIGIGNEGLLHGMLIWIVAPLLFGSWALGADALLLRMVIRTIGITAGIASALILLYVGGAVGVLPQMVPGFVLDFVGMEYFPADDGSPTVSNYALPTLIAAAPMWLTAAIVPSHPMLPGRVFTVVVAALTTGAALVGGRDITVLVIVVVPFIMWVLARIFGGREANRPKSWIIPGIVAGAALAAVAVLTALGNLSVVRTWNRVVSYLAPQSEVGIDDSVRVEQANRLLAEWAQSPVFGHGLGATIDGYVRSDKPWNFELQYHVLLFEAGIVGAVLAAVAAGFAVWGFVLAVRQRPDLMPVVLITGAAAVAMLIANASNPYLQAPGHMWAPYLGLFAINVALTSRRGVGAVVRDADVDGGNDSSERDSAEKASRM